MGDLGDLAKAAAQIGGRTSVEALDELIRGIQKMPDLRRQMVETVVAMQDEWPMPEEGWKRFCRDFGLDEKGRFT